MSEVAARRSSAKKLSRKFCKVHMEVPVLESLSNNVTGLQAAEIAPLLKRDPATGVSKPAVCRCPTK